MGFQAGIFNFYLKPNRDCYLPDRMPHEGSWQQIIQPALTLGLLYTHLNLAWYLKICCVVVALISDDCSCYDHDEFLKWAFLSMFEVVGLHGLHKSVRLIIHWILMLSWKAQFMENCSMDLLSNTWWFFPYFTFFYFSWSFPQLFSGYFLSLPICVSFCPLMASTKKLHGLFYQCLPPSFDSKPAYVYDLQMQ